MNIIDLKGKSYLIKAIVEERTVSFDNVVSTLKKKYFPVDVVVRKEGKLFALQEVTDVGEISEKMEKVE